MNRPASELELVDVEPDEPFLVDVLRGLQRQPKRLSCKYLYDQRGSQLFDAICELDEYYLTRTELSILRRHVGAMARRIGPDCLLVEPGSGSGTKTRLLLDHLQRPAGYVPIDISRDHLLRSAEQLRRERPDLVVLPVCADFNGDFSLPQPARRPRRTVAYYPGSTIGNFTPDEAIDFLARLASLCGPTGGLLIGVDLLKSPEVLEAAYNDAQGVTAEFNLNLLRHLNQALDADFDLGQFRHHAFFNAEESRIEMHLVSTCDQVVQLGDEKIRFRAGESIHTENSYKHTLSGFAELAEAAGWQVEQIWTDDRQQFSVQFLTVA